MQIKGKNQHVIPNHNGWCVVDEANPKIVQHFSIQEEAMDYAKRCAGTGEGEVLVHTSPCENTEMISTVSLPQREYLPGTGFVDSSAKGTGSQEAQKEQSTVESGVSSSRDLNPTYRSTPDETDYYYDL